MTVSPQFSKHLNKVEEGLNLERFWSVTHPQRRVHETPRYKEDAPPNRALIAVHEGVIQDLFHIGESFEWLLDDWGDELSDYLSVDLPNGIHVWEGSVKVHPWYDYYEGTDYDYELIGTVRPATKDEWESYVKGNYPWEISLWLSEEKPEPETTPVSEPTDVTAQIDPSMVQSDDIYDWTTF